LPRDGTHGDARHEPGDVRSPEVGRDAPAVLADKDDRQAGEVRLERRDRPSRLEAVLDDVRLDHHEGEGHALLPNHGTIERHEWFLLLAILGLDAKAGIEYK